MGLYGLGLVFLCLFVVERFCKREGRDLRLVFRSFRVNEGVRLGIGGFMFWVFCF